MRGGRCAGRFQHVPGGFQSMDPEKARRLRQKGGSRGGHRFSAEEAKAAGQKGGKARATKVSPEKLSTIGRQGGNARAAKAKKRAPKKEAS